MTMHQATRDRRRQRGLLDDEPRCSRCDGVNDRLPQRWCRACHNENMRRWRSSRVYVVSHETPYFTQEAALD
jgi:hypothetical protein